MVAALRAGYDALNRVYQGERPAGRLYHDDEMSELFFLHRRYSSASLALRGLKQEAELYEQEKLDLRGFNSRQFRLIIVSELLGLVANWETRDCPAASAAVASSGLRSAFWLWLEDDNRAMGILRNVVEALARLRTYTRNPRRAEKVEARPYVSPRTWLSEAGWRRLQALNMALSELAHTRPTPHWSAAWVLLVALQPEAEEPELRPYRGRGIHARHGRSVGSERGTRRGRATFAVAQGELLRPHEPRGRLR